MNRQEALTSMNDVTGSRSKKSSKVSTLGWIIFATGILYYCYAYLLRVYPSVMVKDLEMHFHITAAALGNLTAFYYYAYAPMQLPVGVTVDRFGARKSLIIACIISVLGMYTFAASSSLGMAELGRFCIGLGSAFAYVTVLKLATVWLPRRYFATATGVATGSGMLAAVFTDMYLTQRIQAMGYHNALYFCLAIGVAIFVLIVLLVKDPKPGQQSNDEAAEQAAPNFRELGHYLARFVRNPQMWVIGAIGALMYMPASVFLDVWGIPYLKAVHHFTANQAAFGVSMTLFGWIIASPVAGALSDRIGSRKRLLVFGTIGAAIIAWTIFYMPGLSRDVVFALLFALGFFCAPHPLCFTLSKENNPGKVSGSSIAFANCLIMLGGVIFQPLLGKILDWHWRVRMASKHLHAASYHAAQLVSHQGVRIYTVADYHWAMAVLPIGLLLASGLLFFVKDTYHSALDH